MEDKNLLEKGGDFLLENSGRALLLGKDPTVCWFGSCDSYYSSYSRWSIERNW